MKQKVYLREHVRKRLSLTSEDALALQGLRPEPSCMLFNVGEALNEKAPCHMPGRAQFRPTAVGNLNHKANDGARV